MNIKRAKEEIKHTVQAYLKKDAGGGYEIPAVRQRPILLMGPSGIGKTAVIEQAAGECGVGLVSYTITHHTRQSAMGLPFIKEKSFGGKMYSVTEYTMSEIIASVYECMERTGLSEGILFLDEINCVSETLAPAMLQFLQCKRFGNQEVPEGWIIVVAGNPPEYNKSVKDFDIVTLDRVRRIDVKEDYSVWKEYAMRRSVHEAILSYLEIRKENFYSFRTDGYGKSFVTARGWEDLSEILKAYEGLGIAPDYELIVQYVQDKKIAEDFADYYELYQNYRKDYRVGQILAGEIPKEALLRLAGAPFDERLSVTGLLLGSLHEDFAGYYEQNQVTIRVHEALTGLKKRLSEGEEFDSAFGELMEETEKEAERRKIRPADKEEERIQRRTKKLLAFMRMQVKRSGVPDADSCFEQIRTQFRQITNERQAQIRTAGERLANAFHFLEKAFGAGQEMVVFVTGLTTDFYAAEFLADNGSQEYDNFHKELLLHDRKEKLLRDLKDFKEDMI